MRECEACGQRLFGSVDRCSRCGRPVAVLTAAGHLSRTSIAGLPGATSYRAAAATAATTATATAATGRSAAPGSPPAVNGARAEGAGEPTSPASPDYDPDATMRFMPIYRSHSDAKNTAALVSLAIALIAAVSSLAWLISQAVTGGSPAPRSSVSTSAKPTAPSTVVPRNATVCTPELARTANTNCTVANRVFSAVRTLGTDLPDSFRVTITDPQSSRKNITYVCEIHAWIECVGPGDATIYVRRQV